MRWRVVAVLGVALVAALAVGYVKYREHAHEQVAKHYVQRSRPEYRLIRDRMARVYLSFRPQHLGGIDRTGLRRAKTLAAFRREVRLAAREGLEGLDYPRAQIKATRQVLAAADTSALKRVDNPPLAGDSRQARESHALAREHGAYIRAIRGFLPRYAALIRYIDSVIRLSARYSVTLTAGVESVQGIGSPAEFNRTVRRLARRLAPISTKLRRLDPPPALQETHKANVTYATGVVRDLKALLRAFEARDLPRIKAIGSRIDRRAKIVRRNTRSSFRRLATRSEFSRKARGLQRQEARIERRYRKLAGEPPRPSPRPKKRVSS